MKGWGLTADLFSPTRTRCYHSSSRSSSNYPTAKAPLETRFPISLKTGRGRGSRLCFIMIGQITAERLVYAFLTSIIAAEGGGEGWREGES